MNLVTGEAFRVGGRYTSALASSWRSLSRLLYRRISILRRRRKHDGPEVARVACNRVLP